MNTSALILMIITWTAILGALIFLFQNISSKRKADKLNEQNKQEQPKKKSYKLLFIIAGFYTLVAIGLILALLIFSKK